MAKGKFMVKGVSGGHKKSRKGGKRRGRKGHGKKGHKK